MKNAMVQVAVTSSIKHKIVTQNHFSPVLAKTNDSLDWLWSGEKFTNVMNRRFLWANTAIAEAVDLGTVGKMQDQRCLLLMAKALLQTHAHNGEIASKHQDQRTVKFVHTRTDTSASRSTVDIQYILLIRGTRKQDLLSCLVVDNTLQSNEFVTWCVSYLFSCN